MSNVEKDQEKFFNQNASKNTVVTKDLFYDWANKEQFAGFDWISGAKNILEYGCGTGGSLDVFFDKYNKENYNIVGVDIAEDALAKARGAYPNYSFLKISDNRMLEVLDESIDAAFMFHVLHHSTGHKQIFDEIFRKVKPGGKFLINDLTSRNPIIRLGRVVFATFTNFFAPKFQEDLVIDGKIPDKYRIDVSEKLKEIQNAGFVISEVGYGHLFFFVFHWVDKFVPVSKTAVVRGIYSKLIYLENKLTKIPFFHNFSEVVYIKAMKPIVAPNSVLSSGDYSDSFNNVVYSRIEPNSYVLDVGCWSGNLGKRLINEKNCRVDGVEINESASVKALENGYAKIYKVNLNSEMLNFDINAKYDYMVFADVLEHLINPNEVLKLLKDFVSDKGRIVVSLPNVAFIQNRLNLLLGKWNYREFGTLDKTHLKFFTMDTAKDLLERSGYKVVSVEGYNQFSSLKFLEVFRKFFPRLFSYQLLLVATLRADE